MADAKDVIRALGLEPLSVEGGFFKESYRSKTPSSQPGRCSGTCIYYLLSGTEISNWHKVASDEIWLYHVGSPAQQILLFPDGSWAKRIIGPDIANGQVPQSLIPAGAWQAASLLDSSASSWGLFGAAVFPGFEYQDFTPGDATALAKAYPAAAESMKAAKLLG